MIPLQIFRLLTIKLDAVAGALEFNKTAKYLFSCRAFWNLLAIDANRTAWGRLFLSRIQWDADRLCRDFEERR